MINKSKLLSEKERKEFNGSTSGLLKTLGIIHKIEYKVKVNKATIMVPSFLINIT